MVGLCTPLGRFEYTIIPVNLIPEEFIDLYDLAPKVQNKYVYIVVKQGMYGSPQAGTLANKLLKERLLQYDYFEVPHTPGLFQHKNQPIWFTLVVDDFRIKYVGKEHIEHLLDILKELYKVEEDWTGSLYCVITLDCHYNQQYVDISMINYVLKKLAKYKKPPPKQAQHCPFEPNQVQYPNYFKPVLQVMVLFFSW